MFLNVSSNCLHEQMHSCISFICLTFSLCVFKCVLKLLASEDAKLHWLHFFTFLHCVFLNVSSNWQPERMPNHIGCIFWIFLHCVPSNVASNRLPVRMHHYIGCICVADFSEETLACADSRLYRLTKSSSLLSAPVLASRLLNFLGCHRKYYWYIITNMDL